MQAYLLTDLTVGALYYRSQIGLLTGWVHHAVYILITEIAIRNAWAHIFCLCAIMEVCASPFPIPVLTYSSSPPSFWAS
jgi:hypothetical protein